MKESLRYLQKAKEILARTPIEDNDYIDIKPVREAFSTAYLAILEAINEALLEKGVHKKELPKSVDAYRIALKKHFATHNAKLARKFEHLYDTLHIAGYYKGLIHDATLVKGNSSATLTMNAEYNPLAPFFKGDFVKFPLEKGDFRGLFMPETHVPELLR